MLLYEMSSLLLHCIYMTVFIPDKSQLVLSYQACVDIKGSQSHTEHAQCVGDWKEGSTYYFAAIINSSHVSRFSREDSFR